MIPLLLDLTLRGSFVTAVVLVLDWSLTSQMHPSWRRAWWILVPLAWLVPLRLPKIPSELQLPLPAIVRTAGALPEHIVSTPSAVVGASNSMRAPWTEIIGIILAAGTFTALVTTVHRTVRTTRRWSGERLCTDPYILNLLEDCKSDAGVTAPIGLIVTSSVSTPVLLGWLRPRILLPQALITSVNP
jgi:beta-lactamase regulating signal transducer with metallopeptidase domain